jgi:hypothetical protein
MHEVILLGISIIALTLIWRLGARRTYLDEARDALFDLRDQRLRQFFLSRENGLHHQAYVKLRKLINGHLRHTENFSFVSYVSLIVLLHRCKDEFNQEQQRHEEEFLSDDSEIQQISDEVRRKSAEIMLIYMVKSSVFARVLMFIFLGVFVLVQMREHLHKLFCIQSWRNYMGIAAMVALVIIPTRIVPGLSLNATMSAMELRSFEA